MVNGSASTTELWLHSGGLLLSTQEAIELQSAITLGDSYISLILCFNAAMTEKYAEPLPICSTENHKCNVHSIPDFQLTHGHAHL